MFTPKKPKNAPTAELANVGKKKKIVTVTKEKRHPVENLRSAVIKELKSCEEKHVKNRIAKIIQVIENTSPENVEMTIAAILENQKRVYMYQIAHDFSLDKKEINEYDKAYLSTFEKRFVEWFGIEIKELENPKNALHESNYADSAEFKYAEERLGSYARDPSLYSMISTDVLEAEYHIKDSYLTSIMNCKNYLVDYQYKKETKTSYFKESSESKESSKVEEPTKQTPDRRNSM